MGRFEVRIPIRAPREILWAVHQHPSVLLRITPKILGVRLDDPDACLSPGACFTIRLMSYGILPGFAWETVIEEHVPPDQFVDTQGRGPFACWRHTHRFLPEGAGSVLIEQVEYRCPFGWVGGMVDRLVIEHLLRAMFRKRGRVLERLAIEASKGSTP